MFGKYLPELGLNVSDGSVMCIPCHEYLQYYFTFKSNCFNVEEKIKNYCQSEGTNSKGQIQLGKVLQFTSKNAYKFQNDYSNLKQEEYCEQNMRIEKIVAGVKNEGSMGIEHQELQIVDHVNLQIEHNYYRYQTKLEKDIRNHVLSQKCVAKAKLYRCKICTFQTKNQGGIKRHVRTHIGTFDTKTYKYNTSRYEYKYKHCPSQHNLTHKDSKVTVYKCKICEYETERKCSLWQHMLLHKDTTEKTVYNCNVCKYQSKKKENFSRHMLLHKYTSQVTVYKCNLCDQQTMYKQHLEQHMSVHEDVFEMIYKCNLCGYQTNFKPYFEQHILTHGEVPEVIFYKCTKDYKDISEVILYQCNICNHQTKYKNHLQYHMLIHREHLR